MPLWKWNHVSYNMARCTKDTHLLKVYYYYIGTYIGVLSVAYTYIQKMVYQNLSSRNHVSWGWILFAHVTIDAILTVVFVFCVCTSWLPACDGDSNQSYIANWKSRSWRNSWWQILNHHSTLTIKFVIFTYIGIQIVYPRMQVYLPSIDLNVAKNRCTIFSWFFS